jgi:hypothetical protein
MAAAAEAMRIRRNITVLLLRERKAADTCTSQRDRGLSEARSPEIRALDLDQTNLTFIYVNALHHPFHRGCFQYLILIAERGTEYHNTENRFHTDGPSHTRQSQLLRPSHSTARS